jgi:hypothetical protein
MEVSWFCPLLSDHYICTITELYIHRVRPIGSTVIILLHIGLCNKIEWLRRKAPIIHIMGTK